MNKNKIGVAFRISVLCFVFFVLSTAALAANTVSGVVYDNKNNPLMDVDVELLDELGAYKQHQRTDSTGRYGFSGLAEGRFTVRVMPFRYDFEEIGRAHV